MKLVIQRVSSASVSVEGRVVSSIGAGLCVLVGVARNDAPEDAKYMCRKLLNVRVFDGSEGARWGGSVMQCGLELLCVSQFTLYGRLKGNKPDFSHAMPGDQAAKFYADFLQQLRSSYQPHLVKDGIFGGKMEVSLVNDGPVTIVLESPQTASHLSEQ